MKRGEQARLHRFYQFKDVEVELINVIDKRMWKFMKSKWNWYPRKSTKRWIIDNYLPDKYVRDRLGVRVYCSFTLEEKEEFKAIMMVHQYVWKRFHRWNRQFNNRWEVKYGEETDFIVRLVPSEKYRKE